VRWPTCKKGQALGGGDDAEVTRVSTYHLALLLIRNSELTAHLDC